MNPSRFFALLALPLALFTACASAPTSHMPEPLGQVWEGKMNTRGGADHVGFYRFSIPAAGEELVGGYRFSGVGCLREGKVTGSRKGAELRLMIEDGLSVMTIKAAIEGGVLYGRYEFTEGPCRGDWGSTVANPLP